MECGIKPTIQKKSPSASSLPVLRGQGSFSSHGNAMYSITSQDSVQVTVIQKVARCGKNPCTSSGVAMAPIQNSVRERMAHSPINIGIEITIVSAYTG